MIKVEKINKSFADKHVLKDVSFSFEAGKTNLVIGASGSGKTTLIKCMVGLHTSDSGKIIFFSQIRIVFEKWPFEKLTQALSYNKSVLFEKYLPCGAVFGVFVRIRHP